MQSYSGLFRVIAILCLTSFAQLCFAVETRIWEQSDQAGFARGNPKNLSVRSDGHLMLAPALKELDSTGVPYLWTVTQDSTGTVYYAGGAPTGATTKVFSLSPGSKGKVFAQLPGLEVHALAVDSQNRVYAAVLPDAKIYRIDSSGKPQLFFDPKCKYVWAMAFDRSGNLFVATGEEGVVYKISPDGKGTVFFQTEETHARSMIIDSSGNLIIGTEPDGLVFRVTPQGQSFVLYQTDKREITSLAEYKGVIYAAAVGNRASPITVTGASPVLPANRSPVRPTGAPRTGTTPPSLAPPIGSLKAAVNGGSDFYRIQKDGFAEKIWSSATDLIYSIVFHDGQPLLATGNKGLIYQVDSEHLFTQLLSVPPTQVTALLQGRNKTLYAITGNVGNLYSIQSHLDQSGVLESEVFDAGDFAYWGKAHTTSDLRHGTIKLETRSGNLNRPQSNWSPWSPVAIDKLGGQVQSPPARFLQYRLTLMSPSAADVSPEVTSIDIAYLPKNIAPHIEQIEIAPLNYRESPSNSLLERSETPSGSPLSLTVPAVGQRRTALSTTNAPSGGAATLQYGKGYVTIRWNADDPNSDALAFKVEVRNKNTQLWRTLKDNLQDSYYSFDTAAFPDGDYVARITASDAPANTPATTLQTSLESDSFTIDNTPPEILNVKTMKSGPRRKIMFTATDALSWIDKAEYSIDGAEWTLLNPVNRVSDSQSLSYQIEADPQAVVAVRIFDNDDNVVVKQF